MGNVNFCLQAQHECEVRTARSTGIGFSSCLARATRIRSVVVLEGIERAQERRKVEISPDEPNMVISSDLNFGL